MQWVKDPAFSMQWLGLLLWHKFNLWPLNFHMLWAWPKKNYKNIADERMLPNLFYEVSITLVLKPEKKITIQRKLQAVSLMNINVKILNGILAH